VFLVGTGIASHVSPIYYGEEGEEKWLSGFQVFGKARGD